MAGADQPSGLMDIASSLTQEEIPFKLRCAICNKLAVNAFRLPCCDQGICEPCQVTLPGSCPVCAHTPLSSDLCKPNKALRTTLKAFLRTEEKKREKDRQSATPATGAGAGTVEDTPAASEQPATETPVAASEDQNVVREQQAEVAPSAEVASEEQQPVGSRPEAGEEPASDVIPEAAATEDQPRNEDDTETQKAETEPNGTEGDGTTIPSAEPDSTQANGKQMFPSPMGFNMPAGGFPMGWNGPNDFNPMAQFMSNGMFNPANPMGMAMDPMAASQGMFGGFGMNMNGMNMNMGMNFDAAGQQAMYGGWDGSQNNMWNGGQDKFNPSAAFANGMGSQYGPSSSSSSAGFGGYNMSPFPNQNQDFSNHGYYGPSGYGRGNMRGRGRGGFMSGAGRGAMHNVHPANNPAFQNPNPSHHQISGSTTQDTNGNTPTDAVNETTGENTPVDAPVAGGEEAAAAAEEGVDTPQLQGIPTIDSLDQTGAGFADMSDGSAMAPGFGRGYMRGSFPGGAGRGMMPMPMPMPMGQGVEGAPAAPRAMRQGLPNTSVLRQRTQSQGGTSVPPSRPSEVSQRISETPREDEPRLKSRSRSRSPSGYQPDVSRRRRRSPSAHSSADEHDRRRDRDRHRRSRREDKYDEQQPRSPSLESSKRSSRRDRDRDRDRDRERDRRSGRRSHRSHRHRTRSRSRSRSRSPSRDIDIPKENGSSRDKTSDTHRPSGKDRPSRREEERERDRDRDTRRRDRERERRHRDRDRDRHREREKKRSRRDRTASPIGSESSSRHHNHHSRRAKRSRNDHEETETAAVSTEHPEKDPHTLEREARDRERLLREQQRRQAMHPENGGSHRPSRDRDRDRDHKASSRRRDARQDRLSGGRRLSYKYEDEEGHAARTTRVETEREADRWA